MATATRDSARQREIDADGAGQRLDNYLLGALKGVPRSHVYRLIRSGQVRVNSGRVGPSYRLVAGARAPGTTRSMCSFQSMAHISSSLAITHGV